MNRKAKNQPKERVVCFCYNVTEQTIIAAIRSGCRSLMDIRRETYASTGCAGCTEEVKKLLRKFALKAPAEEEEPQDPGKVSNG
jgi:NAD(P)H-nitrite reductase large subunit